MNIEDANTKLIIKEIQNVAGRIEDLPTKADVRVAVMDGIQEHEDRCQSRKLPEKVAENTTRIKIMGGARNSLIPASRAWKATPSWAKILVPIIGAIVAAAFNVDLSALGL